MKQTKTIAKPRMLEVILHIGFWVFMLAAPFMFWSIHERALTLNDVMICLGIPCALSICFYINYLYFAPTFLITRNRVKPFFLVNILLVALCVLGTHLWWQLWVVDPEVIEDVLKKPRVMPPRWFFVVKDLFIFIVAIAVGTMLLLSKKWWSEVQARQKAELSRQKAELLNLRNQISPHFLLNTLNNIYALIAFDTEKAQHSVHELSKLLRHMLYENSESYVPLDKELDFLRNYIELMRLRLTSAVEVTFEADIPAASTLKVAPLLYISLVENAFKHGISSTQQGFVHILFSVDEANEMVTCTITNSNHPKDSRDKSGNGIGLEQVQRRLDLLYPDAYNWEKGVDETGTTYHSMLQLKVK